MWTGYGISDRAKLISVNTPRITHTTKAISALQAHLISAGILLTGIG